MSAEDDWDARIVRHRQAEEAAERARLTAQRTRADLTPLDPPPGAWVVEHHMPPSSPYSPPFIRLRRENREVARREGRSLSCCAGTTVVRVIAPDGTVVESYDREGNFWLRHDDPGTDTLSLSTPRDGVPTTQEAP